MKTVNLNEDNLFDINLCIFYQKRGGKLTKISDASRKSIQETSAKRKDEITERLEFVGMRPFVNHLSNHCYKNCTNKTNIKRLSLKREREENELPSQTDDDCPDPSGIPRKSSRNQVLLFSKSRRY